METSLDVEALARVIAAEAVGELTMSDRWFGDPNPDDEASMAEAAERMMPLARRKAERYLAALTGTRGDS